MACVDNIFIAFQISEMRSSGAPRHSRASTKPNEIPRELGVWCEKCNNRLVELKRQVMRMILPEIQGVLQKERKNKNTVCSDSSLVTVHYFIASKYASAGAKTLILSLHRLKPRELTVVAELNFDQAINKLFYLLVNISNEVRTNLGSPPT